MVGGKQKRAEKLLAEKLLATLGYDIIFKTDDKNVMKEGWFCGSNGLRFYG